MANIFYDGPYDLTNEKIDEIITKISPGNYILGLVTNNDFIVKYVGRSDNDLSKDLKKCANEKKYTSFKFIYASSVNEAFDEECKCYHRNGCNDILDNNNHPDRPYGTSWKCPECINNFE